MTTVLGDSPRIPRSYGARPDLAREPRDTKTQLARYDAEPLAELGTGVGGRHRRGAGQGGWGSARPPLVGPVPRQAPVLAGSRSALTTGSGGTRTRPALAGSVPRQAPVLAGSRSALTTGSGGTRTRPALAGSVPRQAPVPTSSRPTFRLKSRGWLVLAALGVCLAAVGFRIGTAVTEYVYVPTESVQVRYGDTLWSIAEARVAAVGGDVREMVQLIRQANHLESSLLLPGEVLEVPLQVD